MRARLPCEASNNDDGYMSLTVAKLHPLFAAQIAGIDITRGIGGADFAELRTAFKEHSVIVLPDQDLDDERQIAFSKLFGPLEMMLVHAREEPPEGGETEFASMRAA